MRKGFTIIEILVSFGILALILGVSVLFLRLAGPTLTLRSAARMLSADLRYTAELANTTQIIHALRVDIPNSRYLIVRKTDPEVLVKEVTLNQGITFFTTTIPAGNAEFNILGATSTPGLITIQHQSGTTSTIDLRPSGYVRIN